MLRKKKVIGQVGFEPTTCRIMRRAGGTGEDVAASAATVTAADPSAQPRTVRLSRSDSRDLSRIESVLTAHVALPTHELAEAADLSVARTLRILRRLADDGKVTPTALPDNGGTLWTARREVAA